MIQKIKQIDFAQWLTLLVLAVPFTYFACLDFLHLPMSIIHLVNFPLAALFVFMVLRRKELLNGIPQVKWLIAANLAFFLFTIIGQVLGYQSILYYWSGLRNNERYYFFFFACILFLKAENRDKYMKIFDIIFVINFVVTLYQFFVLDIKWDYLGGIFGVQAGCNAYTNVFMMIVVTYSILRFMNHQEKGWICLLKCGIAMIITAMAELKMFILEFGAIIALAVLLTKFSRRKIFLMLGGCVGIILGIRLMTVIFPWWGGWFNIKSIWKTATSSVGYTGAGDMNRLTAVPIILENYLTTLPQKLFGLGLGNCDFGPVGSMTSPFFWENYLNNYTAFTSGFIMLETGIIGTVLYLSFFVVLFFAAHSLERSRKTDPVYCQMTKILSLMCFVLYIYNSTLRIEVAYMLFFTLALPFMGSKTAAVKNG